MHRMFPGVSIFSGDIMNYFPHDRGIFCDVLPACALMIRREALDDVGLLDERFFIYCEDTDWCRRFREKAWSVRFFPDAEVIHYGEASSTNAPVRFKLEKLKAEFQYWDKHHGRCSRHLLLIILLFYHIIRFFGRAVIWAVIWHKRPQLSSRIKENLASVGWLLNPKRLR